jgi:hypothetical protein
MAGHGDKLSRKQEAAVAALLAEPTVEAAAAKAGVAYSTLKGWLTRPSFKAAYAAARAQVLERTVALLARYSGAAVLVLARNLTAARAADSTRAAVALLAHAFKAAELQDLAEQLAELRAEVEALQRERGDAAT